jgi:hypothetical protein
LRVITTAHVSNIANRYVISALIEESQRGASSPEYRPGPLGRTELMVELFDNWYEERLNSALKL